MIDPGFRKVFYFEVIVNPIEGKELRGDVYMRDEIGGLELFAEKGKLDDWTRENVADMWQCGELCYASSQEARNYDFVWRTFRRS